MSYAGLLRLANQAAQESDFKLKYSDQELDEKERSLLGGAVDVGISGLAGLGHILDIPGIMARSTLAGRPGAMFEGIMNPDKAIRGTDLQKQWGFQPGFWSGLGVEIATDPLTLLSGGLGAIKHGVGSGAKVGGALIKSGVLRTSDDLVRMGTRKADDVLVRARRAAEQIEMNKLGGETIPVSAQSIEDTMRGVRYDSEALIDIIKSDTKAEAFTNLERKYAKEWINQGLVQQTTGKTGAGLGPRKLRGMLTAEDAVKHSLDPDMAFKSLLGQMRQTGLTKVADDAIAGSNAAERISSLMKMMGHEAVELGPHMRWGVGKLSVPINVKVPAIGLDLASAMDWAGGHVRHGWFGRKAAQLGAKVGMLGTMSREGQDLAPGLHRLQELEMTRATKEVQELVTSAKGLSEGASPELLRSAVEWKNPQTFGKNLSMLVSKGAITQQDAVVISEIRTKSQAVFKESLTRMREAGMAVAHLDDTWINYFPRQSVARTAKDLVTINDPLAFERAIASGEPIFQGTSTTQIHRSSPLREIKGGTEQIRKILMDTQLNDLIMQAKNASDPKQFGQLKRFFKEILHDKYGTTKSIGRGNNVFFNSRNIKASESWEAMSDAYKAKFGKGTKAHEEAFAEWMFGLRPEERQVGLFGNDLFADMEWGLRQARLAAVTNEQVMTSIARWARTTAEVTGESHLKRGTVSLREVLDSVGMNTDIVGTAEDTGELIWKLDRTGVPLPRQHIENTAVAIQQRLRPSLADEMTQGLTPHGVNGFLDNMVLPKHIADDLVRMKEAYSAPEELGEIARWFDSWMTLGKAHLTTPHPGFAGRNLLSGQMRNKFIGLHSWRTVKDADLLMDLSNDVVKGTAEYKPVAQELSRRGLEVNDKNATNVLREWIYAEDLVPEAALGYEGVGAGAIRRNIGVSETLEENVEALGAMTTKGRPGMQEGGRKPLGTWIKEYFSNIRNPMHVAGVQPFGKVKGKRLPRFHDMGKVRATTEFSPIKVGQDVNRWIEGENRIAPWLEAMKKGWDPEAAARRVKDAQVDYAHRQFSPFERNVLQRVFPFYKFRAGQFKWLPQHLTEQPGGPIAQTIRGINRARGEQWMPDWIQAGAAMELGTDQKDATRYLTGLGFMFEDPVGMLGDPKTFALRGGAAMRPALKVPLELMTGQSFFQGGRPIEDIKSVTQSVINNLAGVPSEARAAQAGRLPGALSAEHLLLNTPLSRYVTTLNKLTRDVPEIARGDASGVPGTLAELLTGIGTHKVHKRTKEAVKRGRIAEQMKERFPDMTKEFKRQYTSNEQLAQLIAEEGELGRRKAGEIVAYQAMLNRLAEQGAGRRKERLLQKHKSEKAVKEYAKMLRQMREEIEQEEGLRI